MAVKPALQRKCRKPAPADFLQRIISIAGTVMHTLVPAANEKKEENLCKALQ